MKNLSDSEKKYRTILGGDETNQRESGGTCFKFLKYFFCFHNLCLLVGYVDASFVFYGKDIYMYGMCDLQDISYLQQVRQHMRC